LRSSPAEEKKTDGDEMKQDRSPRPSLADAPLSSSVSIALQSSDTRSSSQDLTREGLEKRASPAMMSREDMSEGEEEDIHPYDETTGNHTPVEDIAMSPIPLDREDPQSLMELPDDLMMLPISPCGPNDDPIVLASRS
jgi:hypothetical protein